MFGRAIWICVLGAISSISCAGKVSNADYIRQEVFPRASFDLSCPAEQFTGQCLDTHCTTAGIKGCGRQATYLFIRRTGQWMMNTSGGSGSSPEQLPR